MKKNTHIILHLSFFLFTVSYSFAQDPQWVMTDKGCKVLMDIPTKKFVPKWTGECKGEYAEGAGKLQYEVSRLALGGDFDIVFDFEGTLVSGKKEGQGKLSSLYPTIIYAGNFKNNIISGEGTMNAEYIVKDNDLLGQISTSKGKYIGTFSNGQFNGLGALYNKKDEFKVNGFWINGTYTNISFWKRDDFDSKSIYNSYNKISISELHNAKGQNIAFDSTILRSSAKYFGHDASIHADFSEDSKFFYSNAFGRTMIFDCENKSLIKLNIYSKEDNYTAGYKIQLEKNRAFNASYNRGQESRDYCFSDKYIYMEKFVEHKWKSRHVRVSDYFIGGVRIYDYESKTLLGEYYLNPDPKEFKKTAPEGQSSLDYFSAMANSTDNETFYGNLGGLLGASIVEGMNAKPDLGLVQAVAINPKYNYIVTSHIFLKDIHIWATNKNDKTKINNSAPALLLKGHSFTPSHFLFDLSGNHLVSVETGVDAGTFEKRKVISILWDMANKKKIRAYEDYFAESISMDSRFLILSKKYILGKAMLTQKPEFIVVEISSGEIVYEYKGEMPVNASTGIVTAAYFSPDQKKIGIACIYNTPGGHLYFPFTGSYAVIYPEYDFTPKISAETKLNSVQSLFTFPVNKDLLLLLVPFNNLIAEKLKSIPKIEPKSEFETPDEYNKRAEKSNQTAKVLIQKYWEKGAGFYNETINNKETFVCKPSALVKYDAVLTEYIISISGYEAKIKIPALEAKSMKEKGISSCTISGEKILNPQTGLFDYKNVMLNNAETGKSYSGNFTNTFSKFISN